MPPRSKLLLLPADILGQLEERIRRSEFSNYAAHEAWLREQGYSGGRSTIHEYAVRNRERIASSKPPNEPPSAHSASACKVIDQRIECLKVAASLGVPREQALEYAEAFMRWAEAFDAPLSATAPGR